jgi:uncharacterized membrane protein
MRRGNRLFLATLLAAAGGCAASPTTPDTGAFDCDTIEFDTTWLAVGRPFFRTYCCSCHTAEANERFGAPEDVNFDTEEEVRSYQERISIRVLDEGTMPLGGGIPDEDLELLDIYLECGL